MNSKGANGTEAGNNGRKDASGSKSGSVASLLSVTGSCGPNIGASTMAAMALVQAPIAIVVCDASCKITLVNEFAREIAQRDPQGKSMKSARSIWGDIIDEEGRRIPVEEWPCMKALQGQSIAAKECELLCENGRSYYVLISAAPLKTLEDRIVGAVVMFTDISANKRRELIRRHEALMNERTRIAGNIHDNVSQGLNAAVLQVRSARKELAQYVRLTRTHLRHALNTTMYSLEEARRATSMFSYDFAEDEDPGVVLRYLARQLFSGLDVKLEFSLHKRNGTLPPSLCVELVRIGKEALTNVVKHADASRVQLNLKYDKCNAELSVIDNGSGFVPTLLSKTREGFGLVSMRARAERLGGKMKIESEPGRGTSVTAILPFCSSSGIRY